MLRIYIEKSSIDALRDILRETPSRFTVMEDAADADLILYGTDSPWHIQATPEYLCWPDKCVAISEWDLPSYFIPACLCSARDTWFSRGRVQGIPYLLSSRYRPHSSIALTPLPTSPTYLCSFQGGPTCSLRKRLLRLYQNSPVIHATSTAGYLHWWDGADYLEQKLTQQREYARVIQESWFVLCPRGAGRSSIRLYEVMKSGRVPVILADDWVRPEDIPWDAFAIFVPEGEMARLPAILESHRDKVPTMAARARKAWEDHCSPGRDGECLADALTRLRAALNPARERQVRLVFPWMSKCLDLRDSCRFWLKYAVLGFFARTGLRSPASLATLAKQQFATMKQSRQRRDSTPFY